jgi:hypothetical protein
MEFVLLAILVGAIIAFLIIFVWNVSMDFHWLTTLAKFVLPLVHNVMLMEVVLIV